MLLPNSLFSISKYSSSAIWYSAYIYIIYIQTGQDKILRNSPDVRAFDHRTSSAHRTPNRRYRWAGLVKNKWCTWGLPGSNWQPAIVVNSASLLLSFFILLIFIASCQCRFVPACFVPKSRFSSAYFTLRSPHSLSSSLRNLTQALSRWSQSASPADHWSQLDDATLSLSYRISSVTCFNLTHAQSRACSCPL